MPYAALLLRPTEALRAKHPAFRRVLDNDICVHDASSRRYSATAAYVMQLASLNEAQEEEIARYRSAAAHWPAVIGSRPSFPDASDIRQLIESVPFAAYLDHLTHIQRGLRAKLAWIEQARRLSEDDCWLDMDELRRRGPRDADMKYLGFWANTSTEREGLWLLVRGCVPLYVAEPASDSAAPTTTLSTLVKLLPSRSVPDTVADQALSSKSTYVPVRPVVEQPTAWNTFFTHARHLGWRPDPVLEHHVVEVPGFEHGWIQTPPVPVKQSSRNWERWILSVYEPAPKQTAPCFFHVSKGRAKSEMELDEDDYFSMYDDENTRLYLLPEKPTYHGLVEPEVFGYPLPRLPHFFPDHPSSSALHELHAKTMGRWVYSRANPGELHAGLVQLRPAPALPTRRPSAVEDDRVTLNDGLYEGSDWNAMPDWHAIGYGRRPTTTPVPQVAAGPTPAEAPQAARAPSPMQVDSRSEARRSLGPNDRDHLSDVTRDFNDWQIAFPMGRWEHEPGRTSRLKPEPRGRFAHYVRIAPRSSLSWRELLRGLTRAACFREVEIDYAFRAEVDGRDVFGVTLPDFRMAESFVATLHRQGVDGIDVDARVLTASEYSSLAAQAIRADSWERPPAPRDAWRRGLGNRSSSRWPRRESPRRYRARSPARADWRRRSPSPRAWRRSSSPRAGPSRARERRSVSPPRRTVSPQRRSVSPSHRGESLPRRPATSTASSSWVHAGSSSWEQLEASSAVPPAATLSTPTSSSRAGPSAAAAAASPPAVPSLPPPWPLPVLPLPYQYEAFARMLASWPSSDMRSVAQAALVAQPPPGSAWAVPPPAPMDVDPPALPPPVLPPMGSFFGLPLQALLSGLTLPPPSTPAAPSLPSPLTVSALPAAAASPASLPAPAPAPAPAPSAASPASAGPSLLSRLSDEAPSPVASSHRSLLDRVERPPLSSRLSDGPGVPDLEDRISDSSDVPRGRKRGGRQVRERWARAKARDGNFDPLFPDGFFPRRRTPSPGAGGAGVV
ncbi:hypothetical protein GGF50DRAFT_121092 [Schizophyllum commune]